MHVDYDWNSEDLPQTRKQAFAQYAAVLGHVQMQHGDAAEQAIGGDRYHPGGEIKRHGFDIAEARTVGVEEFNFGLAVVFLPLGNHVAGHGGHAALHFDPPGRGDKYIFSAHSRRGNGNRHSPGNRPRCVSRRPF